MSKKKLTARSKAMDAVRKVDDLVKGTVRLQVCGSLRREKIYVGDADLVVDKLEEFDKLLFTPKAITNGLTEVLCLTQSFEPGVSKKVDYIINDVLFNVYEAESKSWGAMILFLTGSKWFNIKMRSKAKEVGMKLNQYGLWRNGRLVAAGTEEQIFNALRMRVTVPRNRG